MLDCWMTFSSRGEGALALGDDGQGGLAEDYNLSRRCRLISIRS